MINIDMWYGDKTEEVTGINDKCIGDYEADTMQEVQEVFPQLAECIDKALN